MTLARIKAAAVNNGLPFPGLDDVTRAQIKNLADGIRQIPDFARRLDGYAIQLNGLKAKVGTRAEYADAKMRIEKARIDLASLNRFTRTAADQAIKSGDVGGDDVSEVLVTTTALAGLGASGAAWMVIGGFAALVVACIMPVGVAALAVGVGGALVLIAGLLQTLSALAGSVAPVVDDVAKSIPSGAGVLAVVAGGALLWFVLGGGKSLRRAVG